MDEPLFAIILFSFIHVIPYCIYSNWVVGTGTLVHSFVGSLQERMALRYSLNSSKRYSMTWSSDMLLLRSSSYSRHETCLPRGVSASSEHKGIRNLNKNEVPPWFAVQMGSVAESVAAKVRLFLNCARNLKEKWGRMLFNSCLIFDGVV